MIAWARLPKGKVFHAFDVKWPAVPDDGKERDE